MVMGNFLNHWLKFQADSLTLQYQAYGVSEYFPKAKMLPHIRLYGIDTRNKLMLYEEDKPEFVSADIHIACPSDVDESFSQQMQISMNYDGPRENYVSTLNHHMTIRIYLRDIVITKVPFIITPFCTNGVVTYEANHLGTQRCLYGDGGIDWASD